MKQWLLALLYAALTAAALSWLHPGADRWTDFTRQVATLTPLLRLAIHVEDRLGGCALRRLWS